MIIDNNWGVGYDNYLLSPAEIFLHIIMHPSPPKFPTMVIIVGESRSSSLGKNFPRLYFVRTTLYFVGSVYHNENLLPPPGLPLRLCISNTNAGLSLSIGKQICFVPLPAVSTIDPHLLRLPRPTGQRVRFVYCRLGCR